MPYKTISIKLLRPTGVKKRLLEDAIERYSTAFALLVEDLRIDISQKNLTKSDCMRLLTRDRMGQVDSLAVQPFKDALKVDIAMLLAQKGDCYPLVRTEDEQIRCAIDSDKQLGEKQLDKLLSKYQKQRPLLFCRHDYNRDYSLYRDGKTGRYYAKVYLLNRSQAIESTRVISGTLRCITGDKPDIDPSCKVRYLLLPLDIGPYQQQHLQQIETGEAVPKSALLLRRDKEYYLHIRLWYTTHTQAEEVNTLGVVRGIDAPLQYAVCDLSGRMLDAGAIQRDPSMGEGWIHRMANYTVHLAKRHHSKIVLENLVSGGDDLQINGYPTGISTGDYNRFADIVSHKAQLAGFSTPVRVSARRIYQRCSVCGVTKKANRYDQQSMLCVSCGTYRPVVPSAAWNLTTTLSRYQQSRLTVLCRSVGDEVEFLLDALGISYSCPDNQFAVQSFCYYLDRYLDQPVPPVNNMQRSIMKKLRECGNLGDALHFEYAV